MQKITFIFLNLSLLTLFLCACYGFGIHLIKRVTALVSLDIVLARCIAVCLGMGVFIISLQLLGIFGHLGQVGIICLLMLGLILCLFEFITINNRFNRSELLKTLKNQVKRHSVSWSIAFFIFISMTFQALSPPNEWDEVMYHLPHAREWAHSGYITINQWLRYPYFPYNFDLLYAACLVFSQDVLPHLIHASATMITMVGIYRIGSLYLNRPTAFLAVILFFIATDKLYRTAYVELGLTMFIFFGFVCAYLGYSKQSFKCLCVGVFLVGLAIGTKYQAMIYIPVLIGIVLLRERNLMRIGLLTTLFLIPCIYWYARNYFLVGNPVEPLAGSIFGYHSWNETDMQVQMADIRRVADWPKITLWPAIIALVFLTNRAASPIKAISFFSIYALVTWYFTSHYSRYLMPVYPFLSLLSAIAVYWLIKTSTTSLNKNQTCAKILDHLQTIKLQHAFSAVLLLITIIILAPKYAAKIQVTEEGRAAFLKNKIYSHDIAAFLRNHPEYRLVQISLESDLYYLPRGTIGDVFGPGRYQDFLSLNTMQLAQKITALNANALLISDKRGGQTITSRHDFNDYFILIKSSENAQLYGIK